MRIRKKHNGIVGQLGKLAATLAMAGAGILAFAQLPSLKRYLRIKRIAADHSQPSVDVATAAAMSRRPRWGSTHWPRD